MLTHMNKKPYECKVEGCGKSYCDARSLRRHNENHHSAANQASAAAAAAAAAAVNAISVRVGGTPITLPFISDGKVEGHRTSFLATALQSDRIRYAPPQTVHPSGTHLQPYTTPVSSATGGKTSTGPSTIGALALTTTSSSAAGQLQLLAFQQQEQQQQSGDQENVLSWKQASTLFGSNNVRPPTCPADSQQSSTGRQQSQFSSVEQSTTQTSEIPEGYLGQSLVQNNFSQVFEIVFNIMNVIECWSCCYMLCWVWWAKVE